ncbi:hypothetical protein EYC84_003146 [Monilinia fructicola]|uniref:Uncharacterized protein n=1 Tax=Monilinia fructicola TaxID=38448 RepID=A0A5M9JXC0_MONFR|nr:hypothetical protein EYC84_003146 [Monilinia fructicola]
MTTSLRRTKNGVLGQSLKTIWDGLVKQETNGKGIECMAYLATSDTSLHLLYFWAKAAKLQGYESTLETSTKPLPDEDLRRYPEHNTRIRKHEHRRMGLWQAHDAGGAAAQAPAVAGKDAAGARPRAHEVGESGEEADSGDQEEREGGADGAAKIQAKDLVRTRRYVEKFYSMRTQLQAISLRIQTVRTNEQMMQAMKGATGVLGSMNRSMNLPALQRIAMEFEKENDIMDQRQEMMDDAIDDVTGLEDEEEGEEVVEQVLEEIGIDLKAAMGETPQGLQSATVPEGRVAQAVGGGGGTAADPGDDDLQARLDSLRRD